MTVSQNGWPAGRRDLVSPRYVPGTRVRLVVRNGAAGDLLLEVAALYDLLVQDIDQTADDWGYAERPIRGSTVVSNHASGTAIDLNATCWMLGQPASVNLDAGQITKVREIVAAAAGVVRWGGDYTGRKDPMHFEISNGHTEADCAHALAALRAHYGRPSALQEDDDMSAETEQLIREMHGELFKRLPNRRGPQGAEIVGGGPTLCWATPPTPTAPGSARPGTWPASVSGSTSSSPRSAPHPPPPTRQASPRRSPPNSPSDWGSDAHQHRDRRGPGSTAFRG
jgi:hypothetical protein